MSQKPLYFSLINRKIPSIFKINQVKFHSSYLPVFFLPGLSFGGGGPLGSVIGKVYGTSFFGSGTGMPLGRTAGILSGITIGLGGAIVEPLIC